MLDELPSTDAALRRLVAWLGAPASAREDLMQEARLCLWRLQTGRPGQTPSWYWQGCKFHLQHCLNAGRSLDAPKHAPARRLPPVGDGWELLEGAAAANDDVFSEASAADIMASLKGRLNAGDVAVLRLLHDGLTVGEIARRLRVSHQAVSKHRERIAAEAGRLGLVPPPGGMHGRQK